MQVTNKKERERESESESEREGRVKERNIRKIESNRIESIRIRKTSRLLVPVKNSNGEQRLLWNIRHKSMGD
jgi:hypothetical protein